VIEKCTNKNKSSYKNKMQEKDIAIYFSENFADILKKLEAQRFKFSGIIINNHISFIFSRQRLLLNERTLKSRRTQKYEDLVKSEKPEHPVKSEKLEPPVKSEKLEHSVKSEKGENSTNIEKNEEYSEKPLRSSLLGRFPKKEEIRNVIFKEEAIEDIEDFLNGLLQEKYQFIVFQISDQFTHYFMQNKEFKECLRNVKHFENSGFENNFLKAKNYLDNVISLTVSVKSFPSDIISKISILNLDIKTDVNTLLGILSTENHSIRVANFRVLCQDKLSPKTFEQKVIHFLNAGDVKVFRCELADYFRQNERISLRRMFEQGINRSLRYFELNVNVNLDEILDLIAILQKTNLKVLKVFSVPDINESFMRAIDNELTNKYKDAIIYRRFKIETILKQKNMFQETNELLDHISMIRPFKDRLFEQYNDKRFSDFLLKVTSNNNQGYKEFFLHKIVVGKYFKTSEIFEEDVEALECFIKFLYSGHVNIDNPDLGTRLLSIVEKYAPELYYEVKDQIEKQKYIEIFGIPRPQSEDDTTEEDNEQKQRLIAEFLRSNRVISFEYTNEDADMFIKLGNDLIPCHRVILYSRSKFFRELIEKNPSTNTITIPRISRYADGLELYIDFLYLGYLNAIYPIETLKHIIVSLKDLSRPLKQICELYLKYELKCIERETENGHEYKKNLNLLFYYADEE